MTFRSTCLLILLLATTSVAGQTSTSTEATPDPPKAPASTTEQPQAAPPPPPLADTKCPSGLAIASKCDNSKCTNADHVCYRDMTVSSKKESACCDKLTDFCPVTKMIAKHHKGTEGYQYTYDGFKSDQEFVKKWYRRDYPESGSEGVACPLPFSFTLNKGTDEKFLPVDFDLKKGPSNAVLKNCKANKDCGAGEICDVAYNPTFDSDADPLGLDRSSGGQPVQFCYKLPNPDPEMHYELDPEGVGLRLCNTQKDCGAEDQMCHMVANVQYRNAKNATVIHGVCMSVTACLAVDTSKKMVLNANSQFCAVDDDCAGAGLSRDNAQYDPKCRGYSSSIPQKMCCFVKNQGCRVGLTKTPAKNCSTYFDCADTGANRNLWCDDDPAPGQKQCCNDPKNTIWACPDHRTPLFNEPKCIKTEKNIDSGTCPKKGGICRYGHCCPSLTINANSTGSNTDLGKYLYQTEHDCDPKAALPTGFSFAYCEADKKKVVIIGKYHLNGDRMTLVSGSKCTTNADCAPDGSQVCIYQNDATHLCYYNPYRPLRRAVSTFWKIVLIASLCCGGVFLISTIVCFVCYRSKSVFDTYKKKRGKKEKDSNKTKDGKGDKKKGKKDGKKSKSKSSGGSSKSKKSSKGGNSKEASETGGMSETGDVGGKSVQN